MPLYPEDLLCGRLGGPPIPTRNLYDGGNRINRILAQPLRVTRSLFRVQHYCLELTLKLDFVELEKQELKGNEKLPRRYDYELLVLVNGQGASNCAKRTVCELVEMIAVWFAHDRRHSANSIVGGNQHTAGINGERRMLEVESKHPRTAEELHAC
ncbi:hypothetical protein K438DRAFT_1750283 [Mycena galopus ATCC 62051]|nr:hypothetical protein K438DRAFT_1750283 [Mycena galopus ATCC 62051]